MLETEILHQVIDVQTPLMAADRLLPEMSGFPVLPEHFGGAQELAAQPLPGGQGPGFPLALARKLSCLPTSCGLPALATMTKSSQVP